jgi:hypothetical protein
MLFFQSLGYPARDAFGVPAQQYVQEGSTTQLFAGGSAQNPKSQLFGISAQSPKAQSFGVSAQQYVQDSSKSQQYCISAQPYIRESSVSQPYGDSAHSSRNDTLPVQSCKRSPAAATQPTMQGSWSIPVKNLRPLLNRIKEEMARHPELRYHAKHLCAGQPIVWTGQSEPVSQFFKSTNIEPITDKRFSEFFVNMEQTLSVSYTWAFTSLEEMAGICFVFFLCFILSDS